MLYYEKEPYGTVLLLVEDFCIVLEGNAEWTSIY